MLLNPYILLVVRNGVVKNQFARHSERGKKTRRTKEEVGRQHQGMDRLGVRQVPEGSGEQGKLEKTGCKIICGAPTTLAVKGLMMMMMMMMMMSASVKNSLRQSNTMASHTHLIQSCQAGMVTERGQGQYRPNALGIEHSASKAIGAGGKLIPKSKRTVQLF